MLISVLIEIEMPDPAAVVGDHVHGWFMDAVRHLDAQLADRLHAPVRGKPFALWVGPRFGIGPKGVTRDPVDGVAWIRISSVDRQLSGIIPELVTSSDASVIRLGARRYRRLRALFDGQHPWAGTAHAERMWDRWFSGPAPTGRVRLRFVAPTAFSRGHHSATLYPVAALVFRSLLKTWNTNLSPTIDDNVSETLLNLVREESVDVRTALPRQFSRHVVRGFVGTCEYSCGAKAPEKVRRVLHLLTEFAYFSAVGLKRTMGMGQVLGEQID